MQTSELRREIRSQRRQLSPQTQYLHSLRLQRLAANYSPFRHSRRIAFYLASKGEIDPILLMQQALKAGKQVFLPVLRKRPESGLWFAPFRPGEPLRNNRYQIPEPVVHRHPPVMPWAIDLVFMPLVGFDKHGNRLGMGGGYYDRTFAFKRLRKHLKGPKLIGLAHELQRVDELPAQPWDIAMDAVITEQAISTFALKPSE
jgi:5-formyltetrahydrofolate cyclo-ligase